MRKSGIFPSGCPPGWEIESPLWRRFACNHTWEIEMKTKKNQSARPGSTPNCSAIA